MQKSDVSMQKSNACFFCFFFLELKIHHLFFPPQKLHKSPVMYVFIKRKYNPGIKNPKMKPQ